MTIYTAIGNSQQEDIEAFSSLAKQWKRGWEQGDADALLALYDEDPVLLSQGREPIRGKAAIREIYQSALEAYSFLGQGETEESQVCGNLGYFWHNYRFTATPKLGGEPINDERKAIFILKRQLDHQWKISRLIDNSDHQ